MYQYDRHRRVVRYEFGKRLLELRGSDGQAMVRAFVRKDRFNWSVVAVRDHGRQALIYFKRTDQHENSLSVYDIERSGELPHRERLWKGGKDRLEGWLEEHRDDLDWVQDEWR